MSDRETLAREWPELEQTLTGWWDADLRTAKEDDIAADRSRTLLFLPYPYSSAGGSEAAFPEMYAWDTYFVNLALLEYGKESIVRNHILNQLFMIERYGFVLNGNRTFYRGRSQPPLHADCIWKYISQTGDDDMALRVYPLLKREISDYWCAPHHLAACGLHTNRDIHGDTKPSPEELEQLPLIGELSEAMLAEAETGLDFCPNFEGEVRDFAPLITNCVIVRYLEVLEKLSDRLGRRDETKRWEAMRIDRARRIREVCWSEEKGFFFEYNFIEDRMGELYSLCGYLPMWAGFATAEQANKCVGNLDRFLQEFGLSQTDRQYASPFARFSNVQWNYPAGWPPFQILVPQALRNYGFSKQAEACEERWLGGCVNHYRKSGSIFEKYNVVDGSLVLPKERQDEIPPLHGWSTASCLLAGRNLFCATQGR